MIHTSIHININFSFPQQNIDNYLQLEDRQNLRISKLEQKNYSIYKNRCKTNVIKTKIFLYHTLLISNSGNLKRSYLNTSSYCKIIHIDFRLKLHLYSKQLSHYISYYLMKQRINTMSHYSCFRKYYLLSNSYHYNRHQYTRNRIHWLFAQLCSIYFLEHCLRIH